MASVESHSLEFVYALSVERKVYVAKLPEGNHGVVISGSAPLLSEPPSISFGQRLSSAKEGNTVFTPQSHVEGKSLPNASRSTMLKGLLMAGTVLAAASSPAAAGTVFEALKESDAYGNLRLRYETVDQGGFADNANALTLRGRLGFKTGEVANTTLQMDVDWVESLVSDYNSTINGNTGYPVVADPEVVEINQLYLTNKSVAGTTITLGRQRIVIDDSRFVGNVGWRQNEQTYDAVRVVNKSVEGLTVDLTYLNQVNRIFGDDSPAGRFHGETFLANVGYETPVGKLSAFGYFIDLEDGAALASQTIGVRFAGKKPVGGVKLGYALSYANQKDYELNPVDYSADYYLIEGQAGFGKAFVGGGYEALGSDGGVKAFATPLATLHKFQGWADKFLATPAGGIEDLYVKAGYTVGDMGMIKGLKFVGFYHDFNSDFGSTDYGSEIDLVTKFKISELGFAIKFAHYEADSFGTDTTKLWFDINLAF